MEEKENKIILYKDEEGRLSINTLFADEDVWLTQEQLAAVYQTTQENVSMHLSNIYKDGELDKGGTYKKFLLVRQMMPQGRGSWHDRAHSSRVGFFIACILAIRIFICNFAERITK